MQAHTLASPAPTPENNNLSTKQLDLMLGALCFIASGKTKSELSQLLGQEFQYLTNFSSIPTTNKGITSLWNTPQLLQTNKDEEERLGFPLTSINNGDEMEEEMPLINPNSNTLRYAKLANNKYFRRELLAELESFLKLKKDDDSKDTFALADTIIKKLNQVSDSSMSQAQSVLIKFIETMLKNKGFFEFTVTSTQGRAEKIADGAIDIANLALWLPSVAFVTPFAFNSLDTLLKDSYLVRSEAYKYFVAYDTMIINYPFTSSLLLFTILNSATLYRYLSHIFPSDNAYTKFGKGMLSLLSIAAVHAVSLFINAEIFAKPYLSHIPDDVEGTERILNQINAMLQSYEVAFAVTLFGISLLLQHIAHRREDDGHPAANWLEGCLHYVFSALKHAFGMHGTFTDRANHAAKMVNDVGNKKEISIMERAIFLFGKFINQRQNITDEDLIDLRHLERSMMNELYAKSGSSQRWSIIYSTVLSFGAMIALSTVSIKGFYDYPLEQALPAAIGIMGVPVIAVIKMVNSQGFNKPPLKLLSEILTNAGFTTSPSDILRALRNDFRGSLAKLDRRHFTFGVQVAALLGCLQSYGNVWAYGIRLTQLWNIPEWAKVLTIASSCGGVATSNAVVAGPSVSGTAKALVSAKDLFMWFLMLIGAPLYMALTWCLTPGERAANTSPFTNGNSDAGRGALPPPPNGQEKTCGCW